MDKPYISICIPTYRRPKLLDRLLNYIRNVNLFSGNYEVCITDDSDDGDTAAVVARHGAEGLRVRYVQNPQKLGSRANFNRAMRMARGRFAFNVCDDDHFDPESVSRMIGDMEADAGISGCFAPMEYYLFQENRSLQSCTHDLNTLPERTTLSIRKPLDVITFALSNNVPPESFIFRTDALSATLIWGSYGHPAYAMLSGLLQSGNVIFYRTPFYRISRDDIGQDLVGFRENASWTDFRGGLESLIGMVLRESKTTLTKESSVALYNMIDNYEFGRMMTAIANSIALKKPMDVYEIYMRLDFAMNRNDSPARQARNMVAARQFLSDSIPAVVISQILAADKGWSRLILFDISQADTYAVFFTTYAPHVSVVVCTTGEDVRACVADCGTDQVLAVVETETRVDTCLEIGFAKGQVFVIETLHRRFVVP